MKPIIVTAAAICLVIGCDQSLVTKEREPSARKEISAQTNCTHNSVIIYFEPWSSTISAEAHEMLAFLKSHNEQCKVKRLDVYAYGDAEGSAKDNDRVTQERAEAVRDELLKMGASVDQINLLPRGQENAVREDGVPRPQHRFVEIVVIPLD